MCYNRNDLSKDIIREMDVANYSAVLQESSTHPFSSTMTNQLLIETLLSNLKHDYENSFLSNKRKQQITSAIVLLHTVKGLMD